MEIPHILANLLVFLDFDFFFLGMNSYLSKKQKIWDPNLKKKKFKKMEI